MPLPSSYSPLSISYINQTSNELLILPIRFMSVHLTHRHISSFLSSPPYLLSLLVQGGVDGELDPEDDPNNQGEDEFEEAEDEQPQHRVAHEAEEAVEEEEEPAAPAQHADAHPRPEQPAVEEELVVSQGRMRETSNNNF